MSDNDINLSSGDINLSSDETISDPKYDWTSEGEDSVEVDRSVDVDRRVTLEDPRKVYSSKAAYVLLRR